MYLYRVKGATHRACAENGEEPSREETGAVIHEICQDVLSEIEAVLKDEAGEHRRDVDKVLGIGKIYDRLSEDDTFPYSTAFVVT